MKAIIFDIDGTLADISHRLHYIQDGRKDYKGFYEACVDDKLKTDVAELYNIIMTAQQAEDHWLAATFHVFICTGRPEDYRQPTLNWLRSQEVEGFESLLMRPSGDFRPDYIIKEEMLRKIQAYGYEVLFTIDDRQQVVDMWRRNGITCFQCEQWSEQPKRKWELGKLTLMVGPSGAGKSTWVSGEQWRVNQYKGPRLSVISSDAIRQELLGDWKDQSQNDRVFSLLHSRVKSNVEHGISTVVDATNIRNRDRKAIRDFVPADTVVEYIVIDRPLEEKMATAGWRADVITKDGKPLVIWHDEMFRSNLKAILSGDGDERVVVKDLRSV
jgi:predicted kinase